MIDLKTLKQLVRIMTDNDLTELDLQDGEEKVRLKRGGPDNEVRFVTGAPIANGGAVAPAPAATGAAAGTGGAETPDENEGLVPIASPMVGTFYATPSPDAPPFVNVGDQVGDETVVCIVEAMKVFNEIKAETTGTIARVLVSNGQAVEFGQPLFMVKP